MQQKTINKTEKPVPRGEKYSTGDTPVDELIAKYYEFGGFCGNCDGIINSRSNICSKCSTEAQLQNMGIRRVSVGNNLAPWLVEPVASTQSRSLFMFLLLICSAMAYGYHQGTAIEILIAVFTVAVVAYGLLLNMFLYFKKSLIIRSKRNEYLRTRPDLSEDIRRNLEKGWFHPGMSIYEMELCGGYKVRPRVKDGAICVEVGCI